MKKLIFLFLLFITISSFAEELIGKVIKVSDGDTITVLDNINQKYKIRLKGIDAPESQQLYGDISTQSLVELVYGKEVLVTWDKKDTYYRILGKVIVEGKDVNYQQLKKGLAWYYKQYESDLNSQDRETYSTAEETAKQTNIGLWADLKSIPPWEFRHKGKY
jgi:endonuclease YncB( thermonuclease family)